MRVLVVDDEKPARDELKYMLGMVEVVNDIVEASNGEEALEIIKNNKIDVTFLDIQMPVLTGLEVADEIINMEEKPRIVFVTAYDKYAIKAFELNAVDYLLKPFSEGRLFETVKRLQQKDGNNININKNIKGVINGLANGVKKVPVQSKRGNIKPLDPEDILVAFTENGDVFVRTEEKKYKISMSLKELEELLNEPYFFRCHRSFLVNINAILEVIPWFKGNYHLVLSTREKMEIPVGRTRVDKLKEILHI